MAGPAVDRRRSAPHHRSPWRRRTKTPRLPPLPCRDQGGARRASWPDFLSPPRPCPGVGHRRRRRRRPPPPPTRRPVPSPPCLVDSMTSTTTSHGSSVATPRPWMGVCPSCRRGQRTSWLTLGRKERERAGRRLIASKKRIGGSILSDLSSDPAWAGGVLINNFLLLTNTIRMVRVTYYL